MRDALMMVADDISVAGVRRLEELALNAWPALQQVMLDGWLLRFADGFTRRANSVQPLYRGTGDAAAKVARCEAYYKYRGLPTVFKASPAVDPPDLDALLADQGYRRYATTSVQAISLPAPMLSSATGVVRRAAPEAWLEAYTAVAGLHHADVPLHAAIVRAIVPETYLAVALVDDRPAAVGLGVLDDGWVGLFDLVTAMPYRRRGLASQIIAAILAWGHERGATQGYLQVMADNAPALALYEGLGYRHRYLYWYRVKGETCP